MAAVVGGISRLFQPTIGVLSAEAACSGINPWYFLVGFRMVMLFLAYGPWDSLKNDLVCQWPKDLGDTKTFCSALCFNQEIPIPISSIWVLHFMITLIIVGLMKFVYVSRGGKAASSKDAEAGAESEAGAGCCTQAGQTRFGGWRYRIYILCIVLILITELSFIWALLGLQLPIMNRRVVICYPNDPVCPATAQCTLSGRADKRAILWALAFCAAANVSVCIGYLATHCGQACGCCGGPDGQGKPKASGQGNPSREATGCGCPCNGADCSKCQGDAGGWVGIYGSQGGSIPGMEGCKCQAEGGNCCCRQGNESGREGACNCQNNRWCPCYFQGSEAGQSRNSMCSREDSDGKLLRGDTEVGGDRTEWRTLDGKMQIKEPLRTVAKKGRSSPAGGRPAKYAAKYQVWGKRKV